MPGQLADHRTASILSSLWLFVFLNMLFRDIHEIVTSEFLVEAMAREVSDRLLLLAGIVLEIPILMVVLSKLLQPKWSRRANIGVATLTAALVFSYPPGDLDDHWFVAMEVLGLLAIVLLARRWGRTVTGGTRAEQGT